MDIAKALTDLRDIKQALRRVLEIKTGQSLKGVPFSKYADVIRTLQKTN